MKTLTLAAVVTLASMTLVAQEATATLPDNYKLQFENAWVKVTRVYYPPNARLPAHTFKTEPVGPRTLRSKFASEGPRDAVSQTMQFENALIRVTRAFAPPGNGIGFAASAFPSLVVSLSSPTPGDVRWRPAGIDSGAVAGSVGSLEALRFELKTRPQRN